MRRIVRLFFLLSIVGCSARPVPQSKGNPTEWGPSMNMGMNMDDNMMAQAAHKLPDTMTQVAHKLPDLHQIVQSEVTGESNPSFMITYTVGLSENRRLKVSVTSEPWIEVGWVSFTDELIQKNGHKVVFDCDRIADKIIDDGLVKEIRPYCTLLHIKGQRFWKSTHFIPDNFEEPYTHTHWKKVK